MVYVVRQLPINEDLVARVLFPRVSPVDEPEELIEQKVVIMDTRIQYVGAFEKLALKFRAQGTKCGLITNFPFRITQQEIEPLDAFNFILFFDEYSLFAKPFALEATERSLDQIFKTDIAYLPKFASIAYTEIRFREDNLPHALIALQHEQDSFISCQAVARNAKSRNQYKTLVSCPHYIEVKVQECLKNATVVDEESVTIKVSRLYWLSKQQILETLDHQRVTRAIHGRIN